MFDDSAIADVLRHYLQETAPVLVLRLDASACVLEANAGAQRLLGAVEGCPLAKLVVDFNGQLDLPALLHQAGVTHRLTVSTVAGSPETMGFRFYPLADGVLALASPDFQEQRQLRDEMLRLNGELNNTTRQLHQANTELRELNELKNKFLGMAAHDLRKPVGVIMTYGEFVLDEAGPQLSEQQRGFLRTCVNAATNMHRVIDNFLDLAVIESGQLRLNIAPVRAAEIFGGIEPIARLQAEKKKITLRVEPADGMLRVRADAGKIQQALLNLIGNAVEHSEPGQCVWVTARETEHGLTMAVRDEGPGLAPEEQVKLFKTFGRAGTKKTAGERSTGLGLAIARLMVEAHGGRIWIESTPGQGATFLFTIPAVAEATTQPATRG